MQTIVRNALLDPDNSDFSILPDKIKVAADKNLLKIETDIHVHVDSKGMGRKLWDYVLCSLVGTIVTAIIGYAAGVFKVSSPMIIIWYPFVGIIGIFLFLQWRRHALRRVKDDVEAKNKKLGQLATTEPKLINPTEFEKLARKIMIRTDDKDRQIHINNQARDVVREIASVYYFLREAMNMEYIEITLAEFESTQRLLLQMAVRETKRPRHFIPNFFGYKTAWQYYLENKFFHKKRCPFGKRSHDKWMDFDYDMCCAYVAYPLCLYYEDRFDPCPFNRKEFLKDIINKTRTMPPNVLELAKEIYIKRYGVENDMFVSIKPVA